ncbi:MAG: GNAT family N-acetyltransferase, partial [candidate division Zixibacteria bacterium]|nr:GNAT family N-acetyltransferase [candidate division Zixibacteria bacterium]NIW45023.1 GNAT family N-acetyltransferase [Gammaproteobacteria bacterium]NIX56244.1 GNAT family N-acetyltransferase [candidate division Zixibacteria bacterium]
MVTIRKAVHSDAEILWKIRTEAIRRICARIYSEEVIEKWSATLMPHDWESYLEEKQAIVAVRNEKAVGFGLVDLDTQSLEALFVWPDMAGKGVGRALVAELEDFAL